jgi:phenylalanyl-tRNA synthetase alpha chain
MTHSSPLIRRFYPSPAAQSALSSLDQRSDRTARTIKRLLALPDLTRHHNSPVKFVVDAICNLDHFATFDRIEIPEVVSVRENFDLLNTPADHPARSPSDTYYLHGDAAEGLLLRTQTTTMWPYYLAAPESRATLEHEGRVSALCYGRVFRNDEVDRTHYPCFHQIDGLHIIDKRHGRIQKQDLVDVLVGIAQAVYGAEVETHVTEDRFPFTDPSVELAVKLNGAWLEILGAGCVHPQVLRNFGLDPHEYSGWAFGFGLDRLAMVKMEIPDIRVLWSEDPRITSQFTDLNSRYQAVSNYPATFRDITFVVPKALSLNRFFEVVREEGLIGGEDAIEEVTLVDQYENDTKFGADKKSYSFRIVYRSHGRTLTNQEVNDTQEQIRSAVERELHASLR